MPDSYIGQDIDGHRILEELGRGGMGVVYKAEDIALARPVALKMIARDLASDASFERRFRSEARALARIDSPHITRIYALRRTEEGLFILMEYIGGGTLGDRMDRGVLPWAEARPVVLEMITALEHAHGVGVVHRDIKPGNVLLTDAGHVKVTDFGLAKLRTGENSMATVTQGIAGTLSYMSPEQVRGERSLDGRSDLYALGMTIFEMLSGRLPFGRGLSEFETMRTIVEEDYPPLSEFVPGLPPGVSDAVMKALAKDPEDRYPNAAAMRAAFEAIPVAGRVPRREAATIPEGAVLLPPPAAEPAVPASATPKPSQRWWAGGALAAVLLAVLAVWLWPTDAAVSLRVVTDPPGAVVYLDGERLGRTPVEDETVRSGPARLRVERIGYTSVDTLLSFREGEPVALQFAMTVLGQDEAPVRMLDILSEPTAATVFINGERVGETPATYADTTGQPVRVRVERAGYQPWEQASVALQPDVTTRLLAELRRIPAQDPSPSGDPPEAPPGEVAPGTLVLSADPGGTVQVAGQRASGEGTFSLAPGSHRIRCEHPQYGDYTATVRVRSGQRTAATCHFRTRVNVQANPIWGSIWIDGRSSGETTPAALMLGPGTYRIEVRRDGYGVQPAVREVTISPSLEQRTERLIFEMTEQ